MPAINTLEMGERIKKQRLLIGYSREKLAELIDITPRFCYDIELGQKSISLNTLCKLSDALHVSTDYILFGNTSGFTPYESILGMLELCPEKKREYLETIISSYIQAISER